MTDRPIIFSGPMVKSLLEGRKTQTRRLATSPLRRCEPGDRLYVRENFWWRRDGDREAINWAIDFEWDGGAQFQRERGMRLRPSIHMPRWASRLTLEVKEVRRQKLHDLSEADAIAEGVGEDPDGLVTAYARLWAALHGAESWLSNPEVVALTFRVIQENINRVRP